MNIGILFGGRSYEHEISVITAAQAAAAWGGEGPLCPIYAKDGRFYLLAKGIKIQDFREHRVKGKEVFFSKFDEGGGILCGHKRIPIDCMLMCCHGGEGENGIFSALMESCDIPYTASGVLSSAVTMDKRMTKKLCAAFDIPTPRAISGRRGEDVGELAKILRYPLIVKPARLGSSIGIAVAHDEDELIRALGVAFAFDEDVIVEEVVEKAMEVNCAAFLEGGVVRVGGVENPRSWHEYLTFEDKYEGGKYKSGGNRVIVGELAERVRRQTEKIYRDFELFGIARLDYLYDEAEDILYLNEINSQPGSLSYYLFEEIGIEFPDLLKRVIAEGRERSARKGIIAFNSGVLDNLSEFMRK